MDNCLASIKKYTENLSYEVIVVDNNSKGDVSEITKKYSFAKLIKNNKNIGFAAANNIGLNNARGKYILFLNNDTLLMENSLREIFNYCETKSHDVIIGCKLLNDDGSHQESLVDFDSITNSWGENFFFYRLFPLSKKFNRFHKNYENIVSPVEVDVIKGAFIFGPSDRIKAIGGFDTRFFFYAEETDFCHRFKENGGKVIYYPNTSIIHLGGATTDKYIWFKIKNQSIAKIQIYQKHYKGISFFLIVLFHYCGILIRIPLYLLASVFLREKSLLVKGFYYFCTLFIYPKNLFRS